MRKVEGGDRQERRWTCRQRRLMGAVATVMVAIVAADRGAYWPTGQPWSAAVSDQGEASGGGAPTGAEAAMSAAAEVSIPFPSPRLNFQLFS